MKKEPIPTLMIASTNAKIIQFIRSDKHMDRARGMKTDICQLLLLIMHFCFYES